MPNWADVRRLSALTAPRPAVLGAESPALPPAQPRATPAREPTTATFQIVQYSSAAAMPTAYSERDGARIALIVLRGDTGPATQTLAAMTTPGARAAAHYYAARDGTIYQVVDDQYATWHAGMAEWNGRRQNINRISLGVVVERGPNGYSDLQLAALAWLVDTLRGRYQLAGRCGGALERPRPTFARRPGQLPLGAVCAAAGPRRPCGCRAPLSTI